MKKTAIISSSVIFFLFLTTNAFANSIETRINQTINSSNTSVIQSNSHSKVTVTCDGKTFTYESNGENIDVNPCEGASVKINNNGASATGTSNTTITPPNPTQIHKQVEEKKEEIKKKIEIEKEKVKATITAIPKPTSMPNLNFDLGAWLRSLILSIFQ